MCTNINTVLTVIKRTYAIVISTSFYVTYYEMGLYLCVYVYVRDTQT